MLVIAGRLSIDPERRDAAMAEFQRAMGGLGVRGMDVKRYEIAKSGPLRG